MRGVLVDVHVRSSAVMRLAITHGLLALLDGVAREKKSARHARNAVYLFLRRLYSRKGPRGPHIHASQHSHL